MSHKKNRTISYLYEEMDPSERMEFERELKQDENLLIEVESLKTIQHKLSSISTINPPAQMIEDLCRDLSRTNRARRVSRDRTYILTAAAVIIAAFSSLAYLLISSPDYNSADQPTGQNLTLGGAGGVLQTMNAEPMIFRGEESGTVDPWVDSNEIIRFTDRFQEGEAMALDSMYHQSMQKLTPVINPSERVSPVRQFQLTGTRR